ncbi:MAG TPA: hypothetical protein VIL70_08950, partial [Chthoniobacterales bacterium]
FECGHNDRPVIDHTRPVIDHGARKEDEFIYAEPRAQMFVAEVHDRTRWKKFSNAWRRATRQR